MSEHPLLLGNSDSDFRWRMYMQFSTRERRKTVRWADHHAQMAETWIEHAHRSKGPLTRAFWHYTWKAMKSAFRSATVDQESTYSYDADRSKYAILTGITS